MTRNAMSQYGTSSLPEILPYPQLLPFESTKSIHDIFCYIIKHYGNDGLSVLIYRVPSDDDVYIVCGDWRGNKIDLVVDENNKTSPLYEPAMEFLENYAAEFLNMMRLVKIEQAQYYFAIHNNELVLVDMRVSLNKFAGPGMIRDIFGKLINVQDSIKTEIIDIRSVEAIEKGAGSYEGDLILKPSKFKMFHHQDNNNFTPLYVEIKR
jgi:hypothetical protein